MQLTRLVRFHSGVNFVVGSALSLPIASSIADIVWTQHVTMNLPDHGALVSECARVLKRTGRLASHEWLLRTPGALPFPLPWAPTPELNHAIELIRFLTLLRENEFEPEAQDVSELMSAALAEDSKRLEQQNHPLERISALQNLVCAARDGRLGCFMIVARRR